MGFPEEIKRLRERCFLTQEAFAKNLSVAFSTVNRWETGKARPNLKTMKTIKEFCQSNGIEYTGIEEAWLNLGMEDK